MFAILGWAGFSDFREIAKEKKIEILEFAAVEIPADPADLDARVQLKKIKDAGLVGL